MNAKSRKRVLISSVAMLLVAMLALGTATFAWFTSATNPYADSFSATTTKRSTLLLSDDSRTGWTTHLQYGVADKVMYPASGDGETWVAGTSADTKTGVIDPTTIFAVAPTPDASVTTADYLFADELNLQNNGTADVKNVKITFYLNTTDNTNAADYLRVALVPIDASTVAATDYASLNTDGAKVYGTNTRKYKPIIGSTTTGSDDSAVTTATEASFEITPVTTYTYDVTTANDATSVIEAGAEKYFKLYVWFEGQDTACVDAKSGQKIPGLKFDITSEIVE